MNETFVIVKDESFILKVLLLITCTSIIITPPYIRCTSNQDNWSKEYENQISLNKVNLNFRFEKKTKV